MFFMSATRIFIRRQVEPIYS